MLTQYQKVELALGVKERHAEHQVLFAVTDLIGPCVKWPSWVAKIFWMSKLTNVNAMRLAAFLLCNGLPSHVMHQWLHVRGVKHNEKKLKSTEKAVLEAMRLSDEDVTRAQQIGRIQYFYFDLVRNEYCFANGSPRNYMEGVATVAMPKAIERQLAQEASLPCRVCGQKMCQKWRCHNHKFAHALHVGCSGAQGGYS